MYKQTLQNLLDLMELAGLDVGLVYNAWSNSGYRTARSVANYLLDQ